MKLFQLTNRDGSNLGQPMTGEQINETLLAALEEIEQLKAELNRQTEGKGDE